MQYCLENKSFLKLSLSRFSEHLSVLDVGRYIAIYGALHSFEKGAWALKGLCSLKGQRLETIKQSRFSLYKSSGRSIHKFYRSLTCTLKYFIACEFFLPCWLPQWLLLRHSARIACSYTRLMALKISLKVKVQYSQHTNLPLLPW